MPYKNKADYNAYMRKYLKERKNKQDALTEAYEKTIKEYNELTKKKRT